MIVESTNEVNLTFSSINKILRGSLRIEGFSVIHDLQYGSGADFTIQFNREYMEGFGDEDSRKDVS